MMDRFLRIPAAAAAVGCSEKTIRRALRDPEHPLPAHRLGRKLLVIAERDLERWVATRRVVGLSAAGVEPEIRAFLDGLLQADCNQADSRRRKRSNGAANPAADPLTCSQPPVPGTAPKVPEKGSGQRL